MANKRSPKKRRPVPKTVLRLPDLDQAKSAVLNSLSSRDAQRGYRHAMDEFIEWYCSEPRLSFNRTVVVRYRMHLESRKLSPGTVKAAPLFGHSADKSSAKTLNDIIPPRSKNRNRRHESTSRTTGRQSRLGRR
jgi:hypothetical protein